MIQRCDDKGKHKAFLCLDLAAFFFFFSFWNLLYLELTGWMSGPAGLVVTWSYAKCRWQEKSFPICPGLDHPPCSLQKGIIPSNSVVSGKTICWTAPKHRAWPTDEPTTQGVKQMILCFLPRKKKFNSGIQMNPLWKLISKMVIQWETTTQDWQNHEIQGEMVSWDPNMQPEMDLSQLVLYEGKLCLNI